MILEGIVTSHSAAGVLNVAPMGPIVGPGLRTLQLRPFRTSQTYANLRDARCGVFHITDDVLLLAAAALDRLPELPATQPAEVIRGAVLSDCCRWYEFEIDDIDDRDERTVMQARIVHTGRIRDFVGFNRAKHAVIEAAITATRLQWLDPADVRRQMQQWEVIVDKTAASRDREAFDLVSRYVDEHLQGS